MKQYALSAEAKQDLAEINAYFVKVGGPRLARYILGEIKSAIIFLSRTPGAGHSREDLTSADIKFWPVFSYLIVYNPSTRPIIIARIIHGRREVDAIFARDED